MKDQALLYPPGANDECHTPDYAVKALIPHLPPGLVYWCPFDDENSEFVIQLRKAKLDVYWSHISAGMDFYNFDPEGWDVLVSNPPFTNKAQIFERVISFGKPFALLMSLTWLNDAAPKRLFGHKTPLELLMFEERIQYKGQDKKITFSSAYYCSGLLPKPIMFDSLKKYGMSK